MLEWEKSTNEKTFAHLKMNKVVDGGDGSVGGVLSLHTVTLMSDV